MKPSARVLIVDDHLSLAETLADGLAERGYDTIAQASSSAAAALLQQERIDALVTDLRMPEVDGLGLLQISRQSDAERPVLVMTAYSAVDTAIESIRQGAYHYITKPFKVEELALFLHKALAEAGLRREAHALRRALRDRAGVQRLIGTTPCMTEVSELIRRVSSASVPVLILGETGTGKGLVATAIHEHGNRAQGPLVAINCAALPEPLLESELFGHVKGAFTGATTQRTGLFEEASGGTLFLDEIGEMALPLQSKLLHVLERGSVRALGANKERPVDVRVIAATHRDLRARVAQGLFREDLLYRLDVVSITIPPLRQRRADLPELIEHFFARSREKHPTSVVEKIGPDALERLLAHSWPGNVRELQHVMERAVLLGSGSNVAAGDLPAFVEPPVTSGVRFAGEVVPVRELQRRYAAWAYERLDGRKMLTAETLGIDLKTLNRWLSESPDRDREA